MNKITIICFILLYGVALLKPVAPFIDYAVNKNFIKNVLCINKDKPELKCNGKCHLKKELKKTTNEDAPTKALINLKDYPIGFVHFQSRISLFSIETISNSPTYLNNYSYLFTHNTFRPPHNLV